MADLLLRAKLAVVAPALRWAVRSPWAARTIGRAPRRLQPGARWVTRYDDVADVLRRDRDFGMPYLPRMEELGTRFVLGLDPSPRYHRQVAALRRALARVDDAYLASRVRLHADALLDGGGGEVDVIALTDAVLARTASEALWSGDPLSEDRLADARAISQDIFINPLGDPAVMRRGERALAQLRADIRTVVGDRRSAGAGYDRDVLDRLLAAEGDLLPGDEVVDMLLGTFVAWTTSVSRTMGYAMDELLDPARRGELARARDAACAGRTAAVGDVLLEALRFRPSMPALERVCTRRTRLNGRTVERGDKLLLVLTTAMRDRHGAPCPHEFRPGRPEAEYLHFGRGTHACLGQAIARIQMQEIAGALLRRPHVRRRGPMEMDGPFPRRLPIRFDPPG